MARMTSRKLFISILAQMMIFSFLENLSWVEAHTDVRHCRRHSHLDAGVSLLCQLALEELVQFGVKNAVGDELATFRDGALLSSHDGESQLEESAGFCGARYYFVLWTWWMQYSSAHAKNTIVIFALVPNLAVT